MLKGISKKTIILFTLSCMISLGIGVALGYGIHTQNLSASASTLTVQSNSLKDPIGLGYQGSLQMLFAKLQLQQAGSAKEQSLNYLYKIEELQELQKQLYPLRAEMQLLEFTYPNQDKILSLSLVEACRAQGFIIEGEAVEGGIKISSQQYNTYLGQIKDKLDAVGEEIYQTMIIIQDYMAQYDSYLQGASSAIQHGYTTRAREMGQ